MSAPKPLVAELRFEMAQDFQLAFEAFFSKGTCSVPDVAGATVGAAIRVHLTVADVAQTVVDGVISGLAQGNSLTDIALGEEAVAELASLADQMWAFAVDVNDTTGLATRAVDTPAPSGPDTRLEPGSVLDGRFQIEAFVASGGMGDVYRATHVFLKRPVALKLLRRAFARDKDMWARFQREAELVSKLESPHVVRVFDFGRTSDEQPFLAMEYVEGVTIDALLEGEGPVPPDRAVELLYQVCDGLAEAHALGIIHRDLKPPNIILGRRRDGSILAKILDFGIARLADGLPATKDESQVTHTGLMVGTPAYLAPEQALASAVDARTDIYALGCVAYELLTGRPPFRSENVAKVISMQLTETPAPLEQWKPQLKGWPALTAVVLRALQKAPESRFDSVDLFRAALAEALAQHHSPLSEVVARSPSFLLAPARQSLVGEHQALPFLVLELLRAPAGAPSTTHAWAAAHDVLRRFGAVPDTIDEDGQVWLFAPTNTSGALTAALLIREAIEGVADGLDDGPLPRVIVGCGRVTVPASTSAKSETVIRHRTLMARAPAGSVLANRAALQQAPSLLLERKETTSIDPDLVELTDRVTAPPKAQVLLERDECLRAIDRRLTGLAQGVVAPAVIRAPAGSGRTSILSEIASRARAQAHVVVVAGQSSLTRGRPYGIVAELICQWCGLSLELRDHELPAALGKLKVTPSEREAALVLALGKHTPSPFTPRQAVHSLRAVLAAGARGRRSVWLFDDVEHFDGLSLELVRELMQRPGVGELVIAVASPDLAEARFSSVPALELPPLSPRAVRSLWTAATGTEATAQLTDDILRASRGLPALISDWIAWRSANPHAEKLPHFDDATLAVERLAIEGPRAARVLSVMALAQDQVDNAFIKRAQPQATPASLQRLIVARLVRPVGPRRWVAASSRIAAGALATVGAARGQVAARVAQAMVETAMAAAQPPDVARVAGLWAESGDTVRAVSAWKAAAESAMQLRTPSQAMVALLGWAEALRAIEATNEVAQGRVELLARAASFALLHNEADKARAALDAASAIAQQHQVVSAEHFLAAARVLRSEAKRTRAAEALKQALLLARGGALEALVLAEVAEVREADGEPRLAVENYLVALSKADASAGLARWHGEIDFRGRLEARLGAAYLSLKDWPNARASLSSALTRWKAAHAPCIEARVLANLGALYVQTKANDEAVRTYEAAAAAAAKAGDVLFQAKQLLNLCRVLQRIGDTAALRQRAELTRTLCVHIGWDDGRRSVEALLRPA